jgi:hypothetical protein
MKARVLSLDSDAHLRTQELLPWLVNGMLDADEAAPLAAHLAACERCRDDAEALRQLRAAVDEGEPAGDVEKGWVAMRARLDADASAMASGAAREDPARSSSRPRRAVPRLLAPLIAWLPGVRGGALRRGWRAALPLAVALQAVVIVVLAGALVQVVPRGEPYRALGSGLAPLEAQAVVRFAPEATGAQIADALRSVDARIVSGPTGTGAWLLRLPDASPAALAQLRERPGVTGVESLQGGPAR